MNPFLYGIAKDAWDSNRVDVPGIHRQAGEVLEKAHGDAAVKGGCGSVLVHGPAGGGKTHVLGRFRRWLHGETSDIESWRGAFIYLRLQTTPGALWRHLLRGLVDDLNRVVPVGASQLQLLLAAALAETDPRYSLEQWTDWVIGQKTARSKYLPKGMRRIQKRLGLSLQLGRVLEFLIGGVVDEEAQAWLRGELLPQDDLDRLGLPREPLDREEGENRAQHLVLDLCRLAGPGRPMVICCDQIEALQTEPHDTKAFFNYGRFAADLYNSTSNVVLASCVQSAILDLFTDSVRVADYQRLAGRETALNPLEPDEARQLIVARLEADPDWAAQRAEHSDQPLWPLADDVLDAWFAETGTATARVVLARASAVLEPRAPEPPPPPQPPEEPPSLDDCLRENRRKLIEKVKRNLPPQRTDVTLLHGLELLFKRMEGQWRGGAPEEGPVDAIMYRGADRLALCVCHQTNMVSLGSRFQHLLEYMDDYPDTRLIVIRDERLPINPGAQVTRRRLDEIQDRGGLFLQPSLSVLASLEAMRRLVSEAQSGALAFDDRTVGDDQVVAFYHQNPDTNLKDFYFDLVDPDWRKGEAILAELATTPVITLWDITTKLGWEDAADVETLARSRPDRVGFLSQPQVVLYRVPPEPAS